MLIIQTNAKKLENKQNQWQKIRYDIFGIWINPQQHIIIDNFCSF